MANGLTEILDKIYSIFIQLLQGVSIDIFKYSRSHAISFHFSCCSICLLTREIRAVFKHGFTFLGFILLVLIPNLDYKGGRILGIIYLDVSGHLSIPSTRRYFCSGFVLARLLERSQERHQTLDPGTESTQNMQCYRRMCMNTLAARSEWKRDSLIYSIDPKFGDVQPVFGKPLALVPWVEIDSLEEMAMSMLD
ncbi:hypothetical protein CC78DRAFT_586968 [Lojkania enalia]|uniref:Uncharacterized protein n=1 Tax=Lojkania enalia TaxID=147567 RepID=A0A9P4K342_9PLEO|nr:hypothetical protein CC78DRAFT_586968 [Didymosphaeria enalia]